MAAIERDRDLMDRDRPMTLDELQAALRRDGRTSVGELMSSGKGGLFGLGEDPGEESTLHDSVSGWADRVNFVAARCYQRPMNLAVMLVRPDGYVGWVQGSGDGAGAAEKSLVVALERWFGREK